MDNIKELLEYTVGLHGKDIAFTLKKGKDTYEDISYIRYYEELRCLGEAMIRQGFAGERIAIIGKNSYRWFQANAAAQLTGSVSIPLDKELKYEEFESCLIRSEATVIFYDKKEKARVEQAIASGKTQIRHAFAMYNDAKLIEEGAPTISKLIYQGKELLDSGIHQIDDVEIDPYKVSYLIFTSGTTSQSKIVMLTQYNIVSNCEAMLHTEPIFNTDTNIALLPYHHTFGMTGQWYLLLAGCRTVFCDGLKYIQKNFKEYGVSVFIGVPLLIETMYNKIMKTAEKEGMTGRLNAMRRVCRGLNAARIDIRRTVFKGVLEALGGKLRMVVLGAAAADPEVIKGFNDFGVVCIQGYGLTETSPVLCAERPTHRRAGSIGIPMEGVELDIYEPDENGIGEIIARGPNIMQGYYNNEEATREVLRDDWFHTGDLGRRDKDGYYFITGRKKNVIVLLNGKNVFPEELEQEITPLPYVVEGVVLGIPNRGDQRDPVVSVKIQYDPSAFEGKTEAEIHDLISADIEKINAQIPPYKRIKRVYITDQPMEMTSTGKVRRFLEIEKILAEEKAAEEAAKAEA